MLKVLTCIHQQHDIRLVVVAALICLSAASAAFAGYGRALQVKGRFRLGWIGFTGLVGGAGVWATHFIAMLAYQPGLTIRYEPFTTGLSLAVSVLAVSVGFLSAALGRDLTARASGGAIAGLGVAMMHFTGMAAVRTQAELLWHPGYVIASVLIGMSGAAAAFCFAGDMASRRHARIGAALFVAAVCGLHFTAMAAVSLLPDPQAALSAQLIDRPLLAGSVATLAGMIIVAAAALLWMERLGALATLSSLKDALDGAPSALAFFDSSNRLIFWNAAYKDLVSGLKIEVARGMTHEDILKQADRRGVLPGPGDQTWSASAARAERGVSGEFRMSDGRYLRGALGGTRDGGMVAIFSDVTTQMEAARVLAEARDKAEAANQAKSDFLATMSHEIRTPLNGILGLAQAMQADDPTPAQRERLKVIRRSGEFLLSVLNDILDLSKIEAGELELEEVEFDLEHTVRGALSPFAPMAEKKGVALALQMDEAAKGQYRGDAVRFRQLIYNLLSNAVKFTEDGRIEVSVNRQDEGVSVRIADTGIGISAQQMPTLFDKFVQGDASRTRRFGGSGLGLSICARLAEMMGGSIAATSTEGEGSVFTVWLPLRRLGLAQPRASAFAAAAAPTRAAGEVRVLAAEDNEVNQLVLRTLLNQAGIEPVMVGNGAEALEAWKREDWDVILLDVQMPQMDGPSAAKAIRMGEQESGRRRTPIIAVTANVMVHQLAEYEAAGMDQVVGKPIDAASLYGALDKALDGVRPRADPNSAAA